MNLIFRVLLSALAVVILANFLPGIAVDSYYTAIYVAVALSLLNFFVKPVLQILSLPITILTFGLFLLVINAIIIYLGGFFVDGFTVNSVLAAIIFSFLLSILESFFFSFLDDKKE